MAPYKTLRDFLQNANYNQSELSSHEEIPAVNISKRLLFLSYVIGSLKIGTKTKMKSSWSKNEILFVAYRCS